MPSCPNCGDPYELGDSFCSYCGYALSSKPLPPAQPDGSVASCTCESRNLNRPKARFCRFCGNFLLVIKPQSKSSDAWHSILALEDDETLIDTWYGEERDVGSSTTGRVQVGPKHGEGLFVLTNQKLIWLYRMFSYGEDQYTVAHRIPLEKVTDISHGFDPISYIAITDDEGLQVLSLFSKHSSNPGFSGLLQHRKYVTEDEFVAFQETVMKYRAERKSAILELQRKERVQILLDFSFLKDYMEKGGIMVQKITCANCGGSMPLPETGNTVECPYCKTTHRVEDIFERVKQLIG